MHGKVVSTRFDLAVDGVATEHYRGRNVDAEVQEPQHSQYGRYLFAPRRRFVAHLTLELTGAAARALGIAGPTQRRPVERIVSPRPLHYDLTSTATMWRLA